MRSQGWATGGYDRRCRTLSIKQVSEYLQMGLPHTIRLKVGIEGNVVEGGGEGITADVLVWGRGGLLMLEEGVEGKC